ncbi:MAG TPA: aminoglycoside phosphotransferase family protein [Anaerolineaceae bacterium]|nr:aminoglycoside phosphotransferase family protein [Anaerolineaceae bacterium]
METPDWKGIFEEPVLSAEEKGGGETNSVWQVRTERGEFIVKITQALPHPEKGFWFGLKALFGLDLRENIEKYAELADFIVAHSMLAVPRMMKVDASSQKIDLPFVVSEKVSGEPADFTDEAGHGPLLRDLGDHLGGLDEAPFQGWGSFSAAALQEPQAWPERLTGTIRRLAGRQYPEDRQVQRAVDEAVERIPRLPLPNRFSLIMLDLHPRQFLAEKGRLKAIVDLESHVIGPPELAWTALEFAMSPKDAPAFLEGYRRHLAPPRLGEVRMVYRLLHFLLNDYPGPFADWMGQPVVLQT